jgi:hypothetical protein
MGDLAGQCERGEASAGGRGPQHSRVAAAPLQGNGTLASLCVLSAVLSTILCMCEVDVSAVPEHAMGMGMVRVGQLNSASGTLSLVHSNPSSSCQHGMR